MLKLNLLVLLSCLLFFVYLNTSHVKVKLGLPITIIFNIINLNTSHVKVKLPSLDISVELPPPI